MHHTISSSLQSISRAANSGNGRRKRKWCEIHLSKSEHSLHLSMLKAMKQVFKSENFTSDCKITTSKPYSIQKIKTFHSQAAYRFWELKTFKKLPVTVHYAISLLLFLSYCLRITEKKGKVCTRKISTCMHSQAPLDRKTPETQRPNIVLTILLGETFENEIHLWDVTKWIETALLC